jgi:hypothetical protein
MLKQLPLSGADRIIADCRLDLLHSNVRKFGTIFNTVAEATKLEGWIVRAPKVRRSADE